MTKKLSPITQDDKDTMQYIYSRAGARSRGELAEHEGLALMRATFDDLEVTLLVDVQPDADGEEGDMVPLVILLNPELFERLTPPDWDEEAKGSD